MVTLVDETVRLRRNRRIRTAIAVVVLLAGLGVVGAAALWAWGELRPADPVVAAPVTTGYSTPEETARAYWLAVGAGDDAAARALVAPAAAPVLLDSLGADLGNVVSLTKLGITPAVTPTAAPVDPAATAPPTPATAVPATVVVKTTFAVEYRNQITANNGNQTRFVVLARDGGTGPWRILAVRSQP